MPLQTVPLEASLPAPTPTGLMVLYSPVAPRAISRSILTICTVAANDVIIQDSTVINQGKVDYVPLQGFTALTVANITYNNT